ncbi:MAG: hypothetical protein A3J28_07175 [Acidobacteria bacterium RIFCSPLOWO2_12_FULL_60_22]|nr:MAG: hypothetical protein A3J28_07175 [Acidobacteria bacterium RIFCSPLOWO2_12_FULL_60_22]
MTIGLRSLDRQFGARTVTRIRRIQARFKTLGTTWSVTRYFVVEIDRALEGGLLLGSLLIATSLLELTVRLSVLEHRHADERRKASPRSARKILKEIEEDRQLTFARMLRELKDAQIFTEADVTRFNGLYTSRGFHSIMASRVASFARTGAVLTYSRILTGWTAALRSKTWSKIRRCWSWKRFATRLS